MALGAGVTAKVELDDAEVVVQFMAGCAVLRLAWSGLDAQCCDSHGQGWMHSVATRMVRAGCTVLGLAWSGLDAQCCNMVRVRASLRVVVRLMVSNCD